MASALAPPTRSAAARRAAAWAALTKPRIVGLLVVTTVPAMILAYGGLPPLGLTAAAVLGGALSAMGANAANMVLDRDIDRIMSRTRGRPLPTGRITPRAAALLAGVLQLAAAAVLILWVNALSAALTLAAAAFYILVYTLWLKRRSPSNIVIGGAAGAVPPLVGWAAATGGLGWEPVVLFAIVFFWTPPHFWALAVRYREDYRAAGVPMLPAVAPLPLVANRILIYSLIVVALSLGLAPAAGMGAPYAAAAVGLGAVFLVRALALRRTPDDARARRMFSFSIFYLAGLFGAVAADALWASVR